MFVIFLFNPVLSIILSNFVFRANSGWLKIIYNIITSNPQRWQMVLIAFTTV